MRKTEEEKKKRRKKIVILILLLLLILLCIVSCSINMKNKTQEVIKTSSEKLNMSLNVTKEQEIEIGDTYEELGAMAWYEDENISHLISVDTSKLDLTKPGAYTVIYTVEVDGATKTVERKVIVKDTKAPELILSGSNTVTLTVGTDYTELGYTAIDNYNGDITSSVKVSGTVDTNKIGTYTLTYSVTDSSGNAIIATRTVKVVDTTSPTISLKGTGIVYVEVNGTYTDSRLYSK